MDAATKRVTNSATLSQYVNEICSIISEAIRTNTIVVVNAETLDYSGSFTTLFLIKDKVFEKKNSTTKTIKV